MIFLVRLVFFVIFILSIIALQETQPFIAGCVCGAGSVVISLRVIISYARQKGSPL